LKDRVHKNFFRNFYAEAVCGQVEANDDGTVLAAERNVIFESHNFATIA
jgi:hypothetical protein